MNTNFKPIDQEFKKCFNSKFKLINQRSTANGYCFVDINTLPITQCKGVIENWCWCYHPTNPQISFGDILVSTEGRVFNLKKQTIIQPCVKNKQYKAGYPINQFSLGLPVKNGRRKYINVPRHRLVMGVFASPNLYAHLQKQGFQVSIDHRDRNPQNNSLRNLRWATPQLQAQNRNNSPKRSSQKATPIKGEQWKDVDLVLPDGSKVTNNYQVSNLGRVRNTTTNRFIGNYSSDGYRRVSLCVEGRKTKMIKAHRLVYHSFGNQKCFFQIWDKKQVIHHKNEVRDDNRCENLELVNQSQNCLAAQKTRRQKRLDNFQQYEYPSTQNLDLAKPPFFVGDLANLTQPNEKWRSLSDYGFPMYLISSQGRLWSLHNSRQAPTFLKRRQKDKSFNVFDRTGKKKCLSSTTYMKLLF